MTKMRCFYLFIFCFVTFTALISCSSKNQNIHAPFKADVLHMNPLLSNQSPHESPSFTFEPHTFEFLTDFDNLDGRYFKLYRGGQIDETKSNQFSGKPNPKLNYKIVNNIAIPKDYSTMAMISSYYQFDTIAGKIKDISGISMEEIFNIYGKIEIFFEPKYVQESGSLIIEQFPKENAAYIPSIHKFILFSRANMEHVPLSMNLQVLAHEFGHAIWEFVFDHGKTQTCNRLNAEYAIAGLNEGFADFLSYTLTGSTNILQNSLNFENFARMRNFSTIKFDYELLGDTANEEENPICNQNYYCIGTLFANALFKAQKNLGYNQTAFKGPRSRGEFLTAVIKALQKTRENIYVLPKIPDGFDSCAMANETNSYYNGIILGIFFNSLLSQITDNSLKSTLCDTLDENFGIIGFPYLLRIGVCP